MLEYIVVGYSFVDSSYCSRFDGCSLFDGIFSLTSLFDFDFEKKIYGKFIQWIRDRIEICLAFSD